MSLFIRSRLIRSRPLLVAAAWLCLLAVPAAHAAPAQAPVDAAAAAAGSEAEAWTQQFGETAASKRGGEVYRQSCAACHDAGVPRAPALYILRILPPAAIHRALTTGPMRVQGSALSEADRRAVSEYLSGRELATESVLEPPKCEGSAAQFDFDEPPVYSAWGVDPYNTRYIASTSAGVDAGRVGRLKLKWALGFESATRARSQPALAGGALYVGSEDGRVFALDRETGCQRWAFHAGAEVRTGIVASPWKKGDRTSAPLLYFGDLAGSVYAVDARDGKLAWRDRADPHPSTTLTAAPALHGDRLYVPVSSLEEGVADGKYPCCTFRGSIVAYDARTGERQWQSYVVDEPKPVQATPAGIKQWGPSGVAIWNTPAIDERRGVLYFTTGDNYSSPTTGMSDSVIAMDLATGRIRWVYQALAGDAWNASCSLPDRGNCPEEDGPDYDFGAAAILATSSQGRQYVLAGQKSGFVYALEPDTGKLVWKTKVGRGGILAGVYFGMATYGDRVYVPVNDAPDGREYDEPAKPGLYALDVNTGALLWSAPYAEASCSARGALCAPGIAAAVTATDDLVFTGAGDGWIRVHDARSGRTLWEFDTLQDIVTVSGGKAKGGSMGGGAGPILHDGTLIMPSGYGFAGRMPGNVLLVFEVAR
jgi:polyvinyl alcohol dehydrogenase (cytochrome)